MSASAEGEQGTQVVQKQQSSKVKTGCCGGSAPKGTDACCALDAQAKSEGGAGCGCNTVVAPRKKRCC
jgi:hypothetical protein